VKWNETTRTETVRNEKNRNETDRTEMTQTGPTGRGGSKGTVKGEERNAADEKSLVQRREQGARRRTEAPDKPWLQCGTGQPDGKLLMTFNILSTWMRQLLWPTRSPVKAAAEFDERPARIGSKDAVALCVTSSSSSSSSCWEGWMEIRVFKSSKDNDSGTATTTTTDQEQQHQQQKQHHQE